MPILILLALVAAGAVVYEKSKSTAPSALVTDAARVTMAQQCVNSWVQMSGQGTASQENGNASDPTFVANLRLYQPVLNQQAASGQIPSSWFSSSAQGLFPLRTDGVLDVNTYAVLMALWNDEDHNAPNQPPGAPGTPSAPTNGAPTSALYNFVVTADSGTSASMPASVLATPGQAVQFYVPAGATFMAIMLPAWGNGASVVTPGAAMAQQFVYPGGGGAGTALWTDSAGTIHTTYFQFTN